MKKSELIAALNAIEGDFEVYWHDFNLDDSRSILGVEILNWENADGDDPPKVSRRAAEIGARILKGVKPADIPVEQANEFEFVINAAIARSLRVKIPESVMARATRIVQ